MGGQRPASARGGGSARLPRSSLEITSGGARRISCVSCPSKVMQVTRAGPKAGAPVDHGSGVELTDSYAFACYRAPAVRRRCSFAGRRPRLGWGGDDHRDPEAPIPSRDPSPGSGGHLGRGGRAGLLRGDPGLGFQDERPRRPRRRGTMGTVMGVRQHTECSWQSALYPFVGMLGAVR